MDAINKAIGGWLIQSKSTKAELADRLGMSRNTLLNKIAGESEWTWSQILAIHDITGASLNELAGIEEGTA